MKSSATLLALGIPDLPADWQVVSLEDVCDGIFDCPHSTPKLCTDGPYIVRTQDIREGYFKRDEAAHVSMETYRERVKRVVPSYGDILLSREGTYFGDAAEVPKDTLVCLGQRMVLLRPNAKIIRSSFLRIWINSNSFQKYLMSFRDGSVAERLNVSTIRKLPVVVPPVDTQDFIMGHLVPIEEKIANSRGINQTLEQIAQTIFKSWFVDFEPVKAKIEAKAADRDPERAAMCAISGKLEPELDQLPPEQYQQLAATATLFPDGLVESELGLIPVGWVCRKLEDFVDVVDYVANGSFASLKENVQLQSTPGYALFVRTTDFNSGFSGDFRFVSKVAYEFLKKSSLNGSEVIISNVGDVGTVFRAPKWLGYPMTLGSNAVALKSKIANSFLFHYFKGHEGQFAIQSIVTGSAQLKFNKTNLRGLDVAVPSDSILAQFSAISNSIQNQQDNLEEQVRSLATLRDNLLPKLLSGIIIFS